MMKFAIFREVIKEGKIRRKFLIEMDENNIRRELIRRVKENVGANGAAAVEYAFNELIEDFKKESIKIP